MHANWPMTHPLLHPPVISAVERAAGRSWTRLGFVDLNSRSSHPAGVFVGSPFSVFAKLGVVSQVSAELRGLALLSSLSSVAAPAPVGPGLVPLEEGALLLLESVPEVPAPARTARHWRSIGTALAALHDVVDITFGLEAFDNFFGPLPQSNTPVSSGSWSDFYTTRRLLPNLHLAVTSGHLPTSLADGVLRVADRLPQLCGPEPQPSLLHGDAQQNNFVTTPTEAVVIDPAPYFGHPEIDLALLDYFAPVPDSVFDAYRDHRPIAKDFSDRRELWRLHAYLAVVAVDGTSSFGRPFLDRIATAVAQYI